MQAWIIIIFYSFSFEYSQIQVGSGGDMAIAELSLKYS